MRIHFAEANKQQTYIFSHQSMCTKSDSKHAFDPVWVAGSEHDWPGITHDKHADEQTQLPSNPCDTRPIRHAMNHSQTGAETGL